MAVDGKNASGRLAAATVLWLLVAIFANQDYVYCEGEDQQQLQQQQFQQRLQQQQQQPPMQQQQSQQPNLPQMPLPQQQQQQQQQQPQPPPQPQQQPQLPPPQQQPLPPPPPPPPQQQQRPQSNGMMGPINNMPNELQANMNRLASGQPMNSDFVPNPLPQLQQQLSNIAGPPNFQVPAMQGGGPPQMSNLNDPNLSQGINTPFNSNLPSESSPYQPSMQPNIPSVQNQMRPPTQLTGQMNNAQGPYNSMQGPYTNAQGTMNSAPGPMNNAQDPNLQNKYTQQMLQKPMMSAIPSQIQRFPSSVHYLPATKPMGQTDRPYQFPNSFNNIYDVQPNTQGYPGQQYLNTMNLGELPQMFTSIIPPIKPSDVVEMPLNTILNTFGKFSRYGDGLKDGVGRLYRDAMTKLINQGQSGAQKVIGMSLTGANAMSDITRQLFLPDSGDQQTGNNGGRYNSPQQQQSMPPNYGFNPANQQPPTNMMGYNMQPPGGGSGSFSGGSSYGQGTQGPGPQLNEYAQQDTAPNYGMSNPVSSSQPIVRY